MAKRFLGTVMVLLFIFLSAPIDASAKTYTNKEDVYNIIRDNLLAHNEKFTIKMSLKTMGAIGTKTDLFEIVAALDDKNTSKDADYLKLSVTRWSASWKWSNMSSTSSLTFSAEYETTAEQEEKVDAKIESALKALNLEDASDYEKVKAIHDYLIERISYDRTLRKHSAYDALINKSAVCEGYATSAYRLFTDAGLEARIITGRAGGGPHAWNIVKVDDEWYDIDLTWDDPITNTGEQLLRYDYFLKSEKDFSDHIRASEFSTKAFLKAYPMAVQSYDAEGMSNRNE